MDGCFSKLGLMTHETENMRGKRSEQNLVSLN
jgi:hypothetical protein